MQQSVTVSQMDRQTFLHVRFYLFSQHRAASRDLLPGPSAGHRAAVHTHFQEKSSGVTSGDDHGAADPGCRSAAHQRRADVTLRRFFQALPAQTWLASNQECDRVDPCPTNRSQ